MNVIVIETPQLGDRSYLFHDGEVAVAIDVQRDIDRVQAAARQAGVRITHVAETHMHNDYVTGGLELARAEGAVYLVNGADPVQFDREPVTDGDERAVGGLSLKVVATPGHTDTHVSYVLTHGQQQAVFSGGSLLFGSVGRTDLVDPAMTEELTHAQYASVRRLAGEADRGAELYPTHGFGSFCSSGPASGAGSSTLAEQLTSNHALTDADEDRFVRELIANLTAYPSYYAHMGPANLKGPGAVDLSVPEPLDPTELARRLHDGEWVVDLRSRVAFADKHLSGAISFEYGNGSLFTTFLGWVLPWGDRLSLVGPEDDVRNAIRDLSRIGIDSPDAALGEDPTTLAPDVAAANYPRVDWAGMLAERAEQDTVLDVRRRDEYQADHVRGSLNIPLHELVGRVDEVPGGKIWVHCGSGYRASIGSSLLQRAGRTVVHVDAMFSDAATNGVDLVGASS